MWIIRLNHSLFFQIFVTSINLTIEVKQRENSWLFKILGDLTNKGMNSGTDLINPYQACSLDYTTVFLATLNHPCNNNF